MTIPAASYTLSVGLVQNIGQVSLLCVCFTHVMSFRLN